MAFEPISTQEQLDAIIKERVERERTKFSDYNDLKDKIAGYEKDIEALQTQNKTLTEKQAEFDKELKEKDATIADYATRALKIKAAREAGLPYELAERIAGKDEAEMKADAESLKKLFGAKHTPPAESEPVGADSADDAAYRELVRKIRNV